MKYIFYVKARICNKIMLITKILNKVHTSLFIHGNPFDCEGKDVIICITGNPGIIDFYTEFGEELHKNTGLAVCIVGHAGHEKLPDDEFSKLEGHEHLFNLEGQLKHKLDLLNSFIDKRSKIHFIGHSIGSWFIIELLFNNEHLYKRMASVNLLFPTVQRMANSKNGLWLNNFIRRIHNLVILLFTFLYLLPESVCLFLINIYLWFKALPIFYNKRILKYLNPKVCEKFLFLAYDEMDKVTSLNFEGIEKIKGRTNVIYSVDDGWVPLSYIKDLEIYHPHLQMKKVNIDHAFVLKSSEPIALMVSEFIKTKISNC